MFSVLAIAFVILLLILVLYGFGIVMRRPPSANELPTESCSLCRRQIDKKLLIERQVGDSRVFYFCAECIQQLYEEVLHSTKPSA